MKAGYSQSFLRRARVFAAGVVLALACCAQERLEPAPEGTFTYAVFSDSHRYSGGDGERPLTNAPLVSQVTWLAANLDEQRIAFVTHAGDLADKNTAAHYKLAHDLFARFHGRVPYGIAPGNHDMTAARDMARYQKFFGAAQFEPFAWYGGAYGGRRVGGEVLSGDNANSWQTFSAGGLDFVVLHLECNTPDEVLAWADGVLERNLRRMAIIVAHMYLGPVMGRDALGDDGQAFGRMRWAKIPGGNTPQEMWEKCFSKHENVFLVVSGDQASVMALRQESRGAHGNVVHEVMANYPVPADKEDWLRLYRFDPAGQVVHAFTYSPAQDRLCTGIWHLRWRDPHLFTLDISDAMGRFRARNKK
ncbi:MAG: metallophosphoesterase [Kiritimatiellaeota bacterium]|nr:metallophosphoesterase [Kiritimatiellota bacterium]